MKDAAQHGMKEHGKTEQDMNQMKDNLRAAIRTS
jgi:predicted small metal-binding protein